MVLELCTASCFCWKITINLSGDEGDEEKAPAPAPATSTPDQSRGGAQGGGTNKARRGRKMKK